MRSREELSHLGCVNLVGATIRQAIRDYQDERLKRRYLFMWEDARDFIFEVGRLEEFLNIYGLRQYANCDFIRSQADMKLSRESFLFKEAMEEEDFDRI